MLDFEKPLVELDNRIKEVGARPRLAYCTGLGTARARVWAPDCRLGRPNSIPKQHRADLCIAVISEPSWSRASIWGAAAPLAGTCAACSTRLSGAFLWHGMQTACWGVRQLHDLDQH